MAKPPKRDPALIFDEAQVGPSTHVLVIGLGTYPWLLNGKHENVDVAAGMGQLTSAPISARYLAKWFLDGNFINDERPLASLAMVLSEPRRTSFEHERLTYPDAKLPQGSADDISKAIRSWLDRASSHPENMMFLFYSGHGLTAGNSVLLCRDYGSAPEARFDGAIDLDGLISTLATKVPNYQLLVIDACGSPDPLLEFERGHVTSGRQPLSSSSFRARGGKAAKQSICLATSPYQEAYGRTGRISIYTEALILALEGGGVVIQDDCWVATNQLHTALNMHTRRLAAAADVEQQPERVRSADFRVHRPAVVNVPVAVSLDTDETDGHAVTLAVEQPGQAAAAQTFSGDHPGSPPWVLKLRPAPAQLTAEFDAPCPVRRATGKCDYILPPEWGVVLQPEENEQ